MFLNKRKLKLIRKKFTFSIDNFCAHGPMTIVSLRLFDKTELKNINVEANFTCMTMHSKSTILQQRLHVEYIID